MARQVIDTTTDHGTYKGDPATTAFGKVNANFAALMDSQAAGYVWVTPSTAVGDPSFRRLLAADLPSLSATYVPVAGASAITGAKSFGASTTAGDRVDVSSSGVVGYGSGSGSTAFGLLFDSRAPNISASLFARFQALDISGAATYARVLVSNYVGTQGEYRMAHTGTATAVSWTSTSDERLKKDFVKLEDALDKIDQLTGYQSFQKRTDPYDGFVDGNFVETCGLKAQDVLAVLPAAVNDAGSEVVYDKDGKPISNLLSLNGDGLAALWVEGFKELRQVVKQQRDLIDALKARVDVLEGAA